MQIDEIMEIIRNAELEDKYEMISIKELDLDKQLLKVSEHYWSRKTPYFKKCAATAQ